MITVSVCYEGKVQGVGFRSSILSLAKGFEVTGWVKNLPDGRVELLATGEKAEVEEFLQGSSSQDPRSRKDLSHSPASPPGRGSARSLPRDCPG